MASLTTSTRSYVLTLARTPLKRATRVSLSSTPSPATGISPTMTLHAVLPSQRCTQMRYSSHSPMGAPPVNQRKKVTISSLRSLYRKGEPISVMTAHDFPSAHVADHAGMDMILVGDSLAMVSLGMKDTSEVLVEEMLLHCRSVARATKSAFTVS